MKRGQDLKALRNQNLSVLLSAIWENAPISRKELADLTGLAPSSMTRLIRQLQEHKLIIEVGKGESSGGRQPILLSPNPDAGLIISCDLSGSSLRGGIYDSANRFICMSERPFSGLGSELIKDQLIRFSYELLSHPDVKNRSIIGFGVSTPGAVLTGGIIKESFNLRLKNFPLKELLTKEFGVPVYIEVDTAAAAQAEKYYGAGQGLDDFVYLLVSNGIGGSIFINGQLYQGKAGLTGNMGHIILDKNGPICVCGKRGCLETVAAGPAILGGIRHLLDSGKGDQIIGELIDGNPNELTLKVAAEAAKMGSDLAKEAFENSADHLAFGILIMAALLDIDTFIVGGEIPQCAKDFYFENIQTSLIKYRSLESSLSNITVLPAQLESESFLRGISMLTIQDIFGIKNLKREYTAQNNWVK